MIIAIAVAVVVVAIVVALSSVSDRLGIAPPLILMVVGAGVSFLPFLTIPVIEPHWILVVILPPLLYGVAISMPTVDLRRDFSAVGALAVILVVISAVIFGFIIHWIIPDISVALGVALGAILSPTDAAATTIVKRMGVPSRVGLILSGESLLNDATALVLLRSAIAATAATISFWEMVGQFIWAVIAAVAIGIVVGWAGVRVRRLVHQPAPATAISLLIPFVAYVPSELIDTSGFVAVVAAGLTAAQLGPKHLDARQRVSERENWHTIEFLLEGAVFLGIGLELYSLVVDVRNTRDTLQEAVAIAALSMLILLVLRLIFTSILVQQTTANIKLRARTYARWRRLRQQTDEEMPIRRREQAFRKQRQRLANRMDRADKATQIRLKTRIDRLQARFRRYYYDVDHLLREPMGMKHAAALTWAGMRGVVTLGAAQTLPWEAPHRSLLILVAFMVAAGSLVLQGGTLPWVIKLLGLANADATPEGEWPRLLEELQQAEEECPLVESDTDEQKALAKLHARRDTLL